MIKPFYVVFEDIYVTAWLSNLKYYRSWSVYLYIRMDKALTIEMGMNSPGRKNISSVVGQFGQRLLSFIRKRVNNEADAEDILQDVWFQLTATVDTEPIEQVSSWLFKVARNKITDRYRKKKPAFLEDLQDPDNDDETIGFMDILTDDSKNPEREHLRGLFWKTLDEGLLELPEDQRNVFVWNELEDIPFKKIAERTGENISTLISRKRYAVLYLREHMLTLYEEIINH
jgi:RNA polymerase sigma factor (sigma-70 family)